MAVKRNFDKWNRERRKSIEYNIERSGDLAELTGVVLGDGHIRKFPRTERLRIICHSHKHGYIEHIAALIEKNFSIRPSLIKRKGKNALDISLYQRHLSKRLRIPPGNKIRNNVGIPS